MNYLLPCSRLVRPSLAVLTLFLGLASLLVHLVSAPSVRAATSQPPLAPLKLTATGGLHKVQLIWTASEKIEGVDYYYVYYSTEPGGPYTAILETAPGTLADTRKKNLRHFLHSSTAYHGDTPLLYSGSS